MSTSRVRNNLLNKNKKEEESMIVDSESDSGDSDCESLVGETNVDVGIIITNDDDDNNDTNDDDLNSIDSKKLDTILLKSPFFASKIGGKPSWLDYSTAIPAATSPLMHCDNCSSQLVFLLQIYASIDSESDRFTNEIEDFNNTFHRVLFLFLCTNSECLNNKRTFRVLRCQLKRDNDFYSFQPPPSNPNEKLLFKESLNHLELFYKNLYEKSLINGSKIETPFNLCSVCGLKSSKKCAKCSLYTYCDQLHQLHSWTKGKHRDTCANYTNYTSNIEKTIQNWIDDEFKSNEMLKKMETINFIFPEYEMLIEPEVIEKSKSSSLPKNKIDYKYDKTGFHFSN
jgi:hypothetical protein